VRKDGLIQENFMVNIDELAKMIDHSILQPVYTDEDLRKNCAIARQYHVATVCVKPYATRMAAELVSQSDVKVCAVIGFPHGNSAVEVKVYETGLVCRDGAAEVDMVVNIGKVLQEDWLYVEKELKAVHDECLKNKAILKVIFETDYIVLDNHKIKLCEICSNLKIEFVKTSTGYGFVKGADGKYSYQGATEHDIKLMRKHCAPEVQVKAAGGIRTLDQLLQVREWGATRAGATATQAILEEAKKRFPSA
jgi:deoxyribose-phosphate aldolase